MAKENPSGKYPLTGVSAPVESLPDADANAAELIAESKRDRALEDRQIAGVQALDQTHSASAPNDAKTRFLANISHEMRTPLNAMIGLSCLLEDTPLNAEQTPYVKNIRECSETLLALINDLLDVSRLEAGEVVLEEIEFNLASLVEGIAILVAPQAHAKGLDLVVEPILDLPAIVIGDPGRLRQILLNLLSNAVKFTHRGQIVIAARQTLESIDTTTIRFSVSDSGIGIDPVDQNLLFRPQLRGESSARLDFGGTGIGLALASQLVTKMNGEIGVESSLGAGSIFWFSVPLGKQYRFDYDAACQRLQNTPVLIVDDCLAVRHTLSGYLRTWGAIPTEAATIAEAHGHLVAPFPSGKNGILIVDEDIPGIHSLLRLATRSGSRWHPIVLQATGGATPIDSREFGLPTLSKPVRPAALLHALQTAHQPPKLALVEGDVLLIGDDALNRTVYAAMLKKLGVSVHEAADCVAGFDAATRFEYGLILVDCPIPNSDGYEATFALRRFEASRTHTPIVAVTANAIAGDREKCLAAGMDAYTAKPVTPSGLRDLVVRWMRKPAVPR